MIQFQALVDDLLFEQRIHDHGGDPGFFQLLDRFHLAWKAAGRLKPPVDF